MLSMLGSALALLGSLWFIILRQVIIVLALVLVVTKLYAGNSFKEVVQNFLSKKRNVAILIGIVLLYLFLPATMLRAMYAFIWFMLLTFVCAFLGPVCKKDKVQNMIHAFKETLKGSNTNLYEVMRFWQNILVSKTRALAVIFIWAVIFAEGSIIGVVIALILFIGVPTLLIAHEVAQKIEWDNNTTDRMCTTLVVMMAVLRFVYYLHINWTFVFVVLIVSAVILAIYFGLRDGLKEGNPKNKADTKDNSKKQTEEKSQK